MSFIVELYEMTIIVYADDIWDALETASKQGVIHHAYPHPEKGETV